MVVSLCVFSFEPFEENEGTSFLVCYNECYNEPVWHSQSEAFVENSGMNMVISVSTWSLVVDVKVRRLYTAYEGSNLTNHNSRKLGVLSERSKSRMFKN